MKTFWESVHDAHAGLRAGESWQTERYTTRECGWFLLCGLEPPSGAKDVDALPEEWKSSSMRHGGENQLYDWIATAAGRLYQAGAGHTAVQLAWELADRELSKLPVGPGGLLDGHAGGRLSKWMTENFPAEVLDVDARPWGPGCLRVLLAHPKFIQASRDAWARYNRFQSELAAGGQPQE